VVNAITNQEMALVSAVKGTTTDPVSKTMELLPLGPVVIVDTPGFDDEGSLGEQRVRRTRQVLNRIDIAVLVVDAADGLCACDQELIRLFGEKNIPYTIAWNKKDLLAQPFAPETGVPVSALTRDGIDALKEAIARLIPAPDRESLLVGDLIDPGDFAVLVTPIDKAAPKGRMILPEQQVIRGVIDAGGMAAVVTEKQLENVLKNIGQKPKLVVTDSQVFGYVASVTPAEIPLTSFSILMARWKGFLRTAVKGAAMLDHLKDGDRVLISEGCTHHRQCNDIGTVKIPGWLKDYTGKDLVFDTTSGHGFEEDLTSFALILHCGGCMLTEREMLYRVKCAEDQGVPFTNYGTAIAMMHGILPRSLELFPEIRALLDK